MRNMGAIDRRAFVRQTLLGAAGLAAAGRAAAEKTGKPYAGVSAQTYVWSQVLGRKNQKFEDHLDEILRVQREAGYGGIETMAEVVATPERAEAFGALLERHKTRLSGLYSGAALHEREAARAAIERLVGVARRFRTLGCEVLVCNPDPIGREKTDAELDTQAAMLGELGRALRETGATVHVHCHAPEMRSGGREFRSNLDKTDPADVFLNADVNWIARGGCDPYDLLERYAARIGSTHLRNAADGIWTEAFGAGDIDYRRIKTSFDKSPHPVWLTVELAYEAQTRETRPLAENLAASRRYVREVFGC